MKKEQRIKKNHEFSKVFEKGASFANRQFVLYILNKPGQQEHRTGLTVSKKIGNAVTRNRIKRLLREAVREMGDRLESGNDYVIIARKPVLEMTFTEIIKSLEHVARKAKVLKKQPKSFT
ncbi:ribonuclease P protein component [Alteribacillus sp. HJP-4]|uniref:ribonuclease P protein component n=1 Tax=Alteribacillus sp. HJP-4 TaxID=2775394 RepID=UPI0035CCE640